MKYMYIASNIEWMTALIHFPRNFYAHNQQSLNACQVIGQLMYLSAFLVHSFTYPPRFSLANHSSAVPTNSWLVLLAVISEYRDPN